MSDLPRLTLSHFWFGYDEILEPYSPEDQVKILRQAVKDLMVEQAKLTMQCGLYEIKLGLTCSTEEYLQEIDERKSKLPDPDTVYKVMKDHSQKLQSQDWEECQCGSMRPADGQCFDCEEG